MVGRIFGKTAVVFLACGFLAGCASEGGLSTATIAPEKTAAPKVDPVCVSLAAQIDSLRQDGTVEGLEKAATGKTAKVSVKREALAKQAELNKANTEFQMKCGPAIPRAQTAQALPPSNATAPTTAAKAPAAPAAKPASTPAAGAAPSEGAQK